MKKYKKHRKFKRKYTRRTVHHESYSVVASTMLLGLLPLMMIVAMIVLVFLLRTQVANLGNGVSIEVQLPQWSATHAISTITSFFGQHTPAVSVPDVHTPSVAVSLPKVHYQPKPVNLPKISVQMPPILAILAAFFGMIGQGFLAILSFFSTIFMAIIHGIVWIGQVFLHGVVVIVTGITSAIQAVIAAIVGTINLIVMAIAVFFSTLWDKTVSIPQPFFHWIHDRLTFNTAFAKYFANSAKPFVDFFVASIKDSFSTL